MKIQSFAQTLFPDDPWFLDEPLWSTGRQASNGGHCFPTQPNHQGCIFEEICPKKYVDFNPSEIGTEPKSTSEGKLADNSTTKLRKRELTDKQKRFSQFVQHLNDQGVKGEDYRRKITEWIRNSTS